MALIPWSDDGSLDVPTLDADHIGDARRSGADEAAVGRVLDVRRP